MEPKDEERLRLRFKTDGIDKVKEDLAKNIYGANSQKARFMQSLVDNDEAISKKSYEKETLKVAKNANIISVIGIVISAVALVFSIFAIFKK